MSYLVLARKWRPQRFGDLVGQEHVVRALTNALASGRVGHAFLFSGSRGVGKTTVGRLLAKGLNCGQGVTAEPCGECANCQAIEENRFVDLIEVDAASRTKVDDTRDLLDNVQYLPSVGRYKVYLIDEVHMLSNHSFNALLKTLEEPPEHAKFIFATTEPARIPVTILSRCLQFELKRIGADRIRERMGAILEAEGIPTESEALELLARSADGSLRDGLSLLDQAINFGEGRVADAVVRDMLGTVNRDRVLTLLEAVTARDGAAVLDRVAEVAESGMDLDAALAELLGLLHRVAVMQAVPDRGAGDETLVVEERRRLEALAESTPAEDVQLFYQMGLQGRRDLAAAPDPRVGLEMAVLRMVAFDPFEAVGEERPAAAVGPASAAREQAGKGRPAPEPDAPRRAAPPPAEPQPAAPEADTGSPSGSGTAGDAPVSEWEGIVRTLEMPPSWRSVLEFAVPREFTAEQVRLGFPSEQLLSAGSERFRTALESALAAHFGATPKIVIEELGQGSGEESPAAARERRSREAQESAEQAVAEDPNMQILQEQFGARVESVRPDEQDPSSN
ncbi:DNA polymerase III subunit gamma/tau [Thiohalorhabdus methylotrophus]|uniref:DNA polymerase III subunit gamma/tau n=1 Tax=Thiohalorhabdus methylotrophus TaxID=3242694 RepID=A0ABV4TTQ1_9GAMM